MYAVVKGGTFIHIVLVSLCPYQRDIFNGTRLYKPRSGLPKNVIFHVKPIYNDLVKPEELRRCLHGKT